MHVVPAAAYSLKCVSQKPVALIGGPHVCSGVSAQLVSQ